MSRRITVAIHTYEKALALRALLESEGISVDLNNVNLEMPGLSSGVRVRILESDLPLALRIIENRELFDQPNTSSVPNVECEYLLPVDLSEHSFKAAMVAAQLAHKRKARLTLLYSYIDPYIAGKVQFAETLSYEIGDRRTREVMKSNASKLLNNFQERLRESMRRGDAPVVKLSPRVVEGVPEDAIVEYGKTSRPHLVIMGTRGADRKESEMIGSVTAEVLDEGRFTVLTVPGPASLQRSLKPENILFLSNIDQDDILAIDTLYRLFGDQGTKVTIVHMSKRTNLNRAKADKALKSLAQYCRDNFENYYFEEVPVDYSEGEKVFAEMQKKTDFDLIVMPNHRRNAFSRLFNPGLAHKILFKTDIPMLVIPV